MEKPKILWLLLLFLTLSFSQGSHSSIKPRSQITVIGIVYCDICSNNSFSRHSYFLPVSGGVIIELKNNDARKLGVEVKVECKFRGRGPRTTEEVKFTVNRTTNERGWYKLEIPAVDGIQCARTAAVDSTCRATLLAATSTSKCNVPGYNTTTSVVFFKSSKQNICIYGLTALNFRPSRINNALCGNDH